MIGVGRWAWDTTRAAIAARDHVNSVRELGRGAALAATRVKVGVGHLYTDGLRGRHKRAHDEAAASRSGDARIAGLYHGSDDRALALAILDLGFSALRGELAPLFTNGASASPIRDGARSDRTAGAKVADENARSWWTLEALPVFTAWAEFETRERASWLSRMATSWEAFEDWRDKLIRLRDQARALDLTVHTPPPAELPMTISERGSMGRGSALDAIWTAVKSVVYGAIAVLGFLGLYRAYRDLRAKNFLADPGPASPERYVSYYNRPSYVGPIPARR